MFYMISSLLEVLVVDVLLLKGDISQSFRSRKNDSRAMTKIRLIDDHLVAKILDTF